MIEDEKSTEDPESLSRPPLTAANDNGHGASERIDTRILLVARAIGRQIAREQLNQMETANDNTPRDD